MLVVPGTPPVSVNDSRSTDEDTVLNVAAPGVLANDTDAEVQPLTVYEVEGDILNVGRAITVASGSSYAKSRWLAYV